MLGNNNDFKNELIELIENSIIERQGNICDTWDAVKVMSLPWGVKEFVELEQSEAYSEFVSTLVETSMNLPSGNVANILKADVKTKKDKSLLIMRYQLTTLK